MHSRFVASVLYPWFDIVYFIRHVRVDNQVYENGEGLEGITSEQQQQRTALSKELQEKWHLEHPVDEIG